MKKLFLVAFVAIFSVATYAQDAESVLSNFEKKVNLESVKSGLSNMEVSILMDANGMSIPMTIVSAEGGKMRMEMEAAGQKVLIVSDGEKSYMKAPGQGVQEMPAEMAKQQAKQSDVLEFIKFSREGNVFTVIKAEGDVVVIEQAKADNPKKIIKTMYFNTKTGLLDKVEMKQQGVKSDIEFSQYKDFSGALVPSVMNVKAAGQEAKMTITKITFDYPIMPYMFSKPTE